MSVTQPGLDSLYEQNAGRVFAYCYSKVGSRDVAEWAVGATFDRARAALANGGIDEPELDWLLRTADKFCAPKLCLDVRPFESMLVLQDWRGRTFDEIADELEARYARLEEERDRLTPWRRLLGALNVGPALSWIRGLVGGLGAVKTTAAAVAVVGAVTVVATPLAGKLHQAVRPASTQPIRVPIPARSSSTPAAPAARGRAAQPAGRATADGAPSPRQRRAKAVPAPAGSAGSTVASSSTPSRAGGAGSAAPGGVSASSATSPPRPQRSPRPQVAPTRPKVTARAPAVPTSSAPAATVPPIQTPTVETPTVPSATVSSVTTPTVTTPAVPDVGVPSVSVPSVTTPSATTPTPPDVPSAPKPPSVPAATVPTVTVPGRE